MSRHIVKSHSWNAALGVMDFEELNFDTWAEAKAYAESQTTSDWEVGIGTWYSGNLSLSRDVILASSNANAAVALLPGTKDVFITYPAEKSVYANNSPTDSYVLTAKGAGVPPTWDPLNAALATGNSSIVLNNTNITSNATIAAGQNGISVGPVNTANGVTVTIASGQTWTIL